MNFSKLTILVKCLIYWMLFVFLLFLVGSFLSPVFPPKWERFVYGIFGTFAAILATWVFLKKEKKDLKDYGLSWQKITIPKFLSGILVGSAIFIIILLILISFSDLILERTNKIFEPLSAFLYLSIIPLALMEEIAFRAYPFLKLNQVFGLRFTQFIVALAFALYHIITGWNIQIAFLGPGIWALLFGIAAIWSKGIAFPTGIHVALNLFQQLVETKGGGTESFWVLKQAENASNKAIAESELVGLSTQIVVLIIAIFLTEWYLRQLRKQELKPY